MFLFSCFTGICYADYSAATDAQGSGGQQEPPERPNQIRCQTLHALFILNKYRGLTGDGRVFAG